jgi:hypothetical protein
MKKCFIKLQTLIYKLLSISAFVLFTLFVHSCLQNKSDMVQSIESSASINFEKIGSEHNKGLDYIFEQIKNNSGVSKEIKLKGAKSLYQIVEDASIAFVSKSDYGKSVNSEELAEIINLTYKGNLLKSYETRVMTNIDELDFLSPEQKDYIRKYENIISSLPDDKDITVTIGKIKTLEAEIIEKCSSDEIVPLLSATSVGRYSLQYWEKNLYKWATLFMPEETQNISMFTPRLKNGQEVNATQDDWDWFWDTLKGMGESDSIGAAIGAGIGSLAGGVGAIPGAVSGGCYASAGSGVKSLLQRWGIFS